MKQVFYIPMPIKESDIEKEINNAISKLEYDFKLEWLVDLIKAPDASKFMLVFEKEDGAGSATPSIGVRVIQGSQNKITTEKMLNDTLLELESDEDKSFISLCHPSEFVYIILFEYKAGDFPRVKIIPNPADPKAGSRKASAFLQALDDDENWDLQPYDSFMLDKDNMIILFSEE